jgi:hypothetical protein
MKWQEIKNSPDNTYFLFDGKPLFNKKFIEILKFHSPGIAPVKDETGYYHINVLGEPIYSERFDRAFGFYCNRAVVINDAGWFHIDENGKRVYSQNYAWCGNYQEDLCSVRDFSDQYFHIDLNGNKIYEDKYLYCGDFKDGFACARLQNGRFKHINSKGEFINDKEFIDLGVFHKNFATAKDSDGWFHIDTSGRQIYSRRFACIEPFYNGQAKVERFDGGVEIIGEKGETILKISS